LVLVDHAAEDLSSPYRCVDRDDDIWVVVGRMLIEALVWTMVVEMALVLAEHGTGVPFAVDQDPVGALSPDAADEPLGKAVRPGRPRWDLDYVDAFGGEHRVEGSGELGVPVTDQEPKHGCAIAEVHHQVACLLRRPRRCQTSGDAKDVHPPGGDLHHKQPAWLY